MVPLLTPLLIWSLPAFEYEPTKLGNIYRRGPAEGILDWELIEVAFQVRQLYTNDSHLGQRIQWEMILQHTIMQTRIDDSKITHYFTKVITNTSFHAMTWPFSLKDTLIEELLLNSKGWQIHGYENLTRIFLWKWCEIDKTFG